MLRIFDNRNQPAVVLLHVNDIGWADGIAQPAARAFVQIDVYDHVAPLVELQEPSCRLAENALFDLFF